MFPFFDLLFPQGLGHQWAGWEDRAGPWAACPQGPGGRLLVCGLSLRVGCVIRRLLCSLPDDPEGAFVPPEFDVTGNTFEVSGSR